MSRSRHVQTAVEQALRTLIAERFPPGSQLPPERDLANLLGTSRPTLREIVSSMARTGELETKWGVGTFVSTRARPFVLDLGVTAVLRESARIQGFSATFTNMSTDLVRCEPAVAEALGIDVTDDVWESSRVLCLDDRPAILITDHIATRYRRRSVDLTGFGKGQDIDLLPVLRQVCGFDPVSFEAVLDVETADTDDARLLGVPAGVPLIRSVRLPRDDAGVAVTRTLVRYLPGRVELRITASTLGASPAATPRRPRRSPGR